MLQIDRMEIDDTGGDPAKLAAAIIKQMPDLKSSVPVREIATALDIYEIREEVLVGLEGGLITPDDKSEGAILVNVNRHETRKRYTIAHELGNYVNPWHKASSPEGFRCRSRDMSVEHFKPGDRAAQMEVQANQFAAELLMPPELVRAFMRRRVGVDLDHIIAFAGHFEVSKEAAARRYVAKGDEPAAIVFSKEGTIRYVKPHPDFPRLSVWNRDLLPIGCLSRDSTLPIGKLTDWAGVEGDIWLQNPDGKHVCEQTLAQQNGFRLTLLTLDDASEDDDNGDDEWEPPRFRR